MHRASSLAVLTVFALAAAAVADEYTVTEFTGGYVKPPALPKATELNPLSVTEIIAKKLDDQTVDVTLPFSFPFFGSVYDKISVSDDGWLAFGGTNTVQSENPTLQSTDLPNAVIAALWDRLATRKGDVVTFLKATAPVDPAHPELAVPIPAPNRVFVVAWSHVNKSDKLSRDDLSFEVLLYEGTGVIEIAYSTDKKGVWNKLSYTAGIENETGTRAFGGPDTGNTNRGRPASDQRFTPNVVTVTGTITRDQLVATETGLGPTIKPDIAVAGADVVLVREDKTDASAIIAKGRTDEHGAYSLTSYGIDGSPTFAVDLLCSGAESRVTNGSGVTYTQRIKSGVVPINKLDNNGVVVGPVVPLVHLDASVAVNADVDQDGVNFRKALNIQQAAHTGYAWAQAAFDASGKGASEIAARKQFRQLEFRWVKDAAVVSGYTPASSTMPAIAVISDDANNADAYDDDVVLREYAQHLLANMATFAGKLNAHVWAPPLIPLATPPKQSAPTAAPNAAFLDGFSFWFAAAVQGSARFIDTKLTAAVPPATTGTPTATVYDLETALDPAASTLPALVGQQIAGSVAATLWDLVDPVGDASDPTDSFEGLPLDTGYAVFRALDDRAFAVADGTLSLPTTSAAPTIASFFEKFRPTLATDAAVAVSMARTFIAHKALDDDDDEPNDVAGDAKVIALTVPKTTPLVLNESNTDRFTFVLGTTPLSIAVSFSDAAQADVTIRDAADKEVPLAATPSTTSPIVVTPLATQVAGTYVVQIAWKSGTAAHYSISTFTPPTLAPLPAQWTVGLPFNQALTLAHGVPPATFSIASGAVPGLSVQSAGKSYLGTPTTIGHYPLTFSVTDASGAGPQLLAPFSIDVLEGLTLPSVFGVAADKPISVDLGRGGVAPTWTRTDADPTPGFTVTAGETLHLEGRADKAAAFTVSAKATDPDPRNASLAEKTSQIVVCPAFDTVRSSSKISTPTPFGYWFDAIGGSRVALAVRFSGAAAPPFRTLVDDRGTPMQLGDDVLALTDSSVRIRNLLVPRTARYFVVFDASPDFKGTVAAATLRVLPPRRTSHVGNVATAGATFETRFTAIAGSRATITVRSGSVPKPPLPGAITLLGPDGHPVTLTSTKFAVGGERATIADVPLLEHGEYVLTVGANSSVDAGHSTAGPLLVEVVIVPPKRTPFVLD